MPLPPLTLATLLQVLILSAGALLLISFLRTSRGSGMLRGLAVTLTVGGLGLWGIAWYFELAELQHVLRAILEVAVIVLAILFHPELRRGIMSLGDNRLLGRFLRPDRRDVIQEVADACVSMAKRREGALIAFEMRQPLDTIVAGGVRVDAEVNRLLLENLFHHGTPLHDGGVIVRGERVVAAACIFPLTENRDISKSTGTRHRAAIGLTEETDAITVTVSEETGAIGVCKGGEIDRRVARENLVEVLREKLGETEAASDSTTSWITGLRQAVFARPGEKLAALMLGAVIFFAAWSAVRTETNVTLGIKVVTEGSGEATLVRGQLTIVAPPEIGIEVDGNAGLRGNVSLQIDAEREKINRLLGGTFSARLVIQPGETGTRNVAVDDLIFGLGEEQYDEELDVAWSEDSLRLSLTQLGLRSMTPSLQHLTIDDGDLTAGREVVLDEVDVSPSEVEIRGPAGEMEALDQDLAFEEVTVPEGSAARWAADPSWSVPLELTQELIDRGFVLTQDVTLEIPVRPRPTSVGEVEVDVALVWLDATREDATATYQPPDKRVTLEIEIVGVPLDTDEAASLPVRLRDLVRNEARAFVDVSAVPADELRGEVLVKDIDRDRWLQELPEALVDNLADAQDIELRVRLRESDRELRLVPIENATDGGEDGDDP